LEVLPPAAAGSLKVAAAAVWASRLCQQQPRAHAQPLLNHCNPY